MASDDEKDPPVPSDLVGAPKRIRREQVAQKCDRSTREALADDPND
ncbi:MULTISPECIES: hypothetical protein [unclassified Arthrobacter]|nr:hypothetical protein [Arthrobacter sp. FW305-BF8]UKA54479.1 hypothetical protein LFT45_00505 [Arthrobacter sp. FW305-BF8]